MADWPYRVPLVGALLGGIAFDLAGLRHVSRVNSAILQRR